MKNIFDPEDFRFNLFNNDKISVVVAALIAERKSRQVVDEFIYALYLCFAQSCKIDIDLYDHKCFSAYEHAQRLLINHGIIKEQECRRK